MHKGQVSTDKPGCAGIPDAEDDREVKNTRGETEIR